MGAWKSEKSTNAHENFLVQLYVGKYTETAFNIALTRGACNLWVLTACVRRAVNELNV